MIYRTGKVTEAAFDSYTLRPGDELNGYTIAEISFRLWGDQPVLLLWEAVGDELHARRYLPANNARWINFAQAEIAEGT